CFVRFRGIAVYYLRWVLQSCSRPSDSARACWARVCLESTVATRLGPLSPSGVEEDELLNLAEFLQKLLDAQPRPHIPGLAMKILKQRDSEHTVEGVNPDLAVGPMIHRPPA